MQHISVMGPKTVGNKLYIPEILIRSFVYFSTSRALYDRLRNDYQILSISLLTRITSKISNINENKFIFSIFNSLSDKQKLCIILHDEIYVKKSLLYHGGTIFGRSEDNPV